MEHIQKDEFKVLFISGLTEFCERYSYYIIQALLIFFLVDRYHIAQSTSSTMVGTALSMIYISAIVGGFISDKLIGYYIAAFLGSIMMIIGSYILSISSTENILCIGLTFIAISTGLIKSNVSSFIGQFYDKSGLSTAHRDFGFNIFYVAINLGGAIALFVAPELKTHYGFAMPFYSSIVITIVMFINLFIGFFMLNKYIETDKINYKKIIQAILIIIVYSIMIFFILKNPKIAEASIYVAIVICLAVLYKSAQAGDKKTVLIALLFFCLSILYWAIYFQLFISILLFLDKTVNNHFLGFPITSSQFICFEFIGTFSFGALMGRLWIYFEQKGKPVYDIDKFNLGFVFLAIFLILFYISTQLGSPDSKVSTLPIIIAFIILSLSELSLSAIGLSLMTKIAPKGFVSLYMGIWLVTLGIGGKISGFLSSSITINDNIATSRMNMANGLKEFIGLTIIGIVICLLARKKIMKEINY